MSSVIYDVEKLKELWHQGQTHAQIASALGCPVLYVSQLRVRHDLPRRRQKYRPPSIRDPSPAELERLKKELREKHLAEMRALG